MTITVRLFSVLEKYLPPHAADNECTMEMEAGDTVLDVVKRLKIPIGIPRILLVNGQQTTLDSKDRLADRDVVAMFPPMAGG